MPRFKFEKLVRDNIVDTQIKSGAKPHFRTLGPDEHRAALVSKAQEELLELAQAATLEERITELADLQQVIDDLAAVDGVSKESISKRQLEKAEKAGTFATGIFIEYIDLQDGDSWIEYFRKNPDRYPEL